jgi:hypothetical protein
MTNPTRKELQQRQDTVRAQWTQPDKRLVEGDLALARHLLLETKNLLLEGSNHYEAARREARALELLLPNCILAHRWTLDSTAMLPLGHIAERLGSSRDDLRQLLLAELSPAFLAFLRANASSCMLCEKAR